MAYSTIIGKEYSAGSIKSIDYSNAKIIQPSRTVLINETLPFRIKFTNIGINAYGPSNAAPIGIAIIGLNNYVM